MERSLAQPRLEVSFVRRLHESTMDTYRVWARASASGAIETGPGYVLVCTGASDSMGNALFVTRPARRPRPLAERAREFFARRQVPWTVVAFPGADTSIAPALGPPGFHDEGRFPGMVLDRLPTDRPKLPNGYRVARVRTRRQLADLEKIGARAYGFPESEPEAGALGRSDLLLYAGYFRGAPASIGSLIPSHGVAGIAYVGTAPRYQGRGFARALVHRALVDGRQRGCRVAFLWATPRGRPVYEALGFRAVLDYRIWTVTGSEFPSRIR